MFVTKKDVNQQWSKCVWHIESEYLVGHIVRPPDSELYSADVLIKISEIPEEIVIQLWPLCAGFESMPSYEFYPEIMNVQMSGFVTPGNAERSVKLFNLYLTGIAALHEYFGEPERWSDENVAHWYRLDYTFSMGEWARYILRNRK